MNDKIKNAFDGIVADDALKANTETFVRNLIECRSKPSHTFGRRLSSVLAAMVLIIGAIGAYSVYAEPVSYIDIEVNPSVELALNCFDRVVDAVGMNEDGESVIQGLSLKHMDYTNAVDAVLESAEEKGYLDGNSDVLFTVNSGDADAFEAGLRCCGGFNRYHCRFGNPDGSGNTGQYGNGNGSCNGGRGG
jgi:hypothetical protein